jgi:hypothetical protein
MFLLSDILTYMRRIIKTANQASVPDAVLIDYVNRFYINDVDARIQLFDIKKKYQFMTTPGVDQYNMPLYDIQIENQDSAPKNINMYPVYQGFLSPCYINGINCSLQTQKTQFFNIWPNIIQPMPSVAIGDGGATYTIQLPILPMVPPPNPPFNAIIRGHVDMQGIIATGQNIDPPAALDPTSFLPTFLTNIPVTSVDAKVFITSIGSDGTNILVTDSGQFLHGNQNYGLLMQPGKAPFGNLALPASPDPINQYSTTQNTINYLTGTINVTFPSNIPPGNNINVSCFFFQSGLPRAMLFYNNTLTLRSVPATQYLVELDGYLTPAAFLNSADAIPFGYMSEYIARGAARKILADTGDKEQFGSIMDPSSNEAMFREQEILVWKRSQRQWTATRTQTIYSQGLDQGQMGNSYNNGGTI